MDSVKILIQGYARKLRGGKWDATATTTLIKSGGKKVIIDPGEFPEALKAALQKEGLNLSDIDQVACSHSHGDHRKGAILFPEDRVFEPYKFKKKLPENMMIPGTAIRVIYTPGHVANHAAFTVDTPEGRCAIAGDVIWWEDDEEQKTDYKSLIEHTDPVATNQELLRESRRKLLSMADYVIPGHGKIFTVKKV